MSQASETGGNYVTLEEAKGQLSIDPGLTIHDVRIKRLIGSAIDMAEDYTNRSLGELLELNSPTDSSAVPLPNPKDSPNCEQVEANRLFDFDPTVDTSLWTPQQWHAYWRDNPIQQDQSMSLRRPVKEAILLFVEVLFDRNPQTMKDLEAMAYRRLDPYRIAIGV
jgi:Phage gp6-like head-tail connector protein